jgi:hypothetical protein
MGVGVATIGGLLSLYRFQEKWVEYRVTAENLKREKYFFLTGTAPYEADDKFQILVMRVEAILAAENVQWAESAAAKKRSVALAPHCFPPRVQVKAHHLPDWVLGVGFGLAVS